MSTGIVTPRGRALERASAADVAGIVAIETRLDLYEDHRRTRRADERAS